jgi:hypothetical protein
MIGDTHLTSAADANPYRRPMLLRLGGIIFLLLVTFALMGVIIFLNKTLPNDSQSQFKPHLGSGEQTHGQDGTSTAQLSVTSLITKVAKAPGDPPAVPGPTPTCPIWMTVGCGAATTDPFVPPTVTTAFTPGMTGLPMTTVRPDPLPFCGVGSAVSRPARAAPRDPSS